MGGRGVGTPGKKNGGGNVRRGGGMETRGSRFLSDEAEEDLRRNLARSQQASHAESIARREVQRTQGVLGAAALPAVSTGTVPLLTVGGATLEQQDRQMEVVISNEFDMGRKMMEINTRMREGVQRILSRISEQGVGIEELKSVTKDGLVGMMESVEAVMNMVGDGIQQDRRNKSVEQERMDRMEMKLKENAADVEEMRSARDRGMKKESVQAMKDKIKLANRQLKYVDMDFGRQTNDKREIVDKMIGYMREDVNIKDRKRLDILIRRTKFVVLGKGTTARTLEDQVIPNVPIMLEARTEADKLELEDIMRCVHWYPVYHWPVECVEFVKEARSVIRGEGYSDQNCFIKIRPEEREGKMQIKAEVKDKRQGSRFRLVAVWEIPPADKEMWDRGTMRFKSFGGRRGGE